MANLISPTVEEWATRADAVRFARERLGFTPDPQQERVLRCDDLFVILNCTRQWGKSTLAAIKALHLMEGDEESLVIVVSPSDRQSREFVRKAEKLVRKLGYKVRGDGDNDCSILLPNGSRIVGLPGKESTIRGFSSVSMLIVDEAAKVSDELYATIRPMIAVSRGGLWMMSTPAGSDGFFYNTWSKGGPEWTRIAVPATECPRISPEFLEAERRDQAPQVFQQEYMCQFGDPEKALFDEDLLRSLLRDDVVPLMQRNNPEWHKPGQLIYMPRPQNQGQRGRNDGPDLDKGPDRDKGLSA